MPVVDIKGVGKAQFPDGMSVDDIRAFLRKKYSQRALSGQSDLLSPVSDTASPYAPSLVDKIGGGIASALTDTGIISDNYRAQQIGKNISTIGEFLPGVGDATAGDDFGRALQKGNYGEAALHGASAIPLLGDMAIFAGVLAKNADLGALSKAKILEDTGADRNKIWKETGWVNDKGDWKFEISDKLDPFEGEGLNVESLKNIDEWGSVAQGDFLKHPELYKQYPDVPGFVRVQNQDEKGGSFLNDVISLNTRDADVSAEVLKDVESVNLHELQHAIQQREGFERGGNPSQFSKLSKSEIDEFTQTWGDVDFLKKHGEERFEFLFDRKPTKDEIYLAKSTSHEKIRDNINKLTEQESPMYQQRQYERLGGEAEARNVQTRLNMTPEQRRASPPWETLDVPEDELIYRK